jgi:hypothetical protein
VLTGHEQGAWVTPPYSAADYTAQVGAWVVQAGDVLARRYRLSGRTLHVNIYVVTSDVTGASAYLQTAIPGGFTAAVPMLAPMKSTNAGASILAMVTANAVGATVFTCYQVAGAPWGITTGGTEVALSLALEVS